METEDIPPIGPIDEEKQQEEAAIPDPAVDELNSSVKQCSIQTDSAKAPETADTMDTAELLPTEDRRWRKKLLDQNRMRKC